MTTVVALANIPTSSPTDVAVYFLNQALLSRRKSTVDGNSITTEYVYTGGVAQTPTTVLVTVDTNVKTNTVRTSISLRTVQTVTVDDIVTETEPVIVTISWTMPGSSEDTSKILGMIGTLYSLTFNGVTTKVPNSGTIDKLNRSIVDSLFG